MKKTENYPRPFGSSVGLSLEDSRNDDGPEIVDSSDSDDASTTDSDNDLFRDLLSWTTHWTHGQPPTLVESSSEFSEWESSR